MQTNARQLFTIPPGTVQPILLTCNSTSRTYCINMYISPNGLNGILIGLVFAFFFVFGILQLSKVQTPSLFHRAPIDFGVIDK